MARIFIGKCRGIKIYKDTDLKQNDFYLTCGENVIIGILNNSDRYAIILNSEKVIDLAIGNTGKKDTMLKCNMSIYDQIVNLIKTNYLDSDVLRGISKIAEEQANDVDNGLEEGGP